MKVVAVIPARYGSTRFEGKPLAGILGKPMVQHVVEGVGQSRLIKDVIVATDDRRILETVASFGGRALMTSTDHRTGSDRVAEVARKLRAEIIVNVQGDEPLIRGVLIDRAIRPLLRDPSLQMATLMTRFQRTEEWLSPHIVKVVVDQKHFALYFSRAPIPFPRDVRRTRIEALASPPQGVYKHIGVYVYRRSFLLRLSKMRPTPLEELEKLEQLRALEYGYRIKLTLVDYEPLAVDTPEDLKKVIDVLSKRFSRY